MCLCLDPLAAKDFSALRVTTQLAYLPTEGHSRGLQGESWIIDWTQTLKRQFQFSEVNNTGAGELDLREDVYSHF